MLKTNSVDFYYGSFLNISITKMIDYQTIINYVHNFIEKNTDPRTKEKFMISSPVPTIILSLFYLLLVKKILPAYMKRRPPFQLKSVLTVYNLFQVILSAYIVYLSYGSGFTFIGCRDLDQSTTNPNALMAIKAVYATFLLKFVDFFDTIFFVLRKKDNQVSFLHLYHHGTVPFNAYLLVRFHPGGLATMITGTNALIHVVMYTYYLLSGLGPRYQQYLWWKKYLTAFQMIQFAYAIFQSIAVILTRDTCPISMQRSPFVVYFIAYVASLLFLFHKFYEAAYVDKNERKIVKNSKYALS